jgi:hypothetical protein
MRQFVIFTNDISRFDNEPITAQSANGLRRSTRRVRQTPLRRDRNVIVSQLTQILWSGSPICRQGTIEHLASPDPNRIAQNTASFADVHVPRPRTPHKCPQRSRNMLYINIITVTEKLSGRYHSRSCVAGAKPKEDPTVRRIDIYTNGFRISHRSRTAGAPASGAMTRREAERDGGKPARRLVMTRANLLEGS